MRCTNCLRCAAISFSLAYRDCSWFARCDANRLHHAVSGFQTIVRSDFTPPAAATGPHACDPEAPIKLQRRCSERAPEFAWLPSPPVRTARLPRVYIYDHAIAWRTHAHPYDSDDAAMWKHPFGRAVDAFGTTASCCIDFMNAVYARALFHRTSNPEKASLFFIPSPLMFEREASTGLAAWCAAPTATLDEYWSESRTNFFRRFGGRDHFTVFLWRESLVLKHGISHGAKSKGCHNWTREAGVANITKLVGVSNSPWYREPWTQRIMRPYLRKGSPSTIDADTSDALRLLEVPYSAGSVHNRSFWREERARPLLVFASFNERNHRNSHGQMDLRRVLRRQCEAAPRSRCHFEDLYNKEGGLTERSSDDLLLKVLHAMGGAIFSLQPAGDDPARKGIIDSLTMGCIPVIFYREQRELWQLHWGEWVNRSTVYLPAEEMLSNRTNIISALQSIPAQRVRRMQHAIRNHAHRIVYSPQPSKSGMMDAFDITLRAVYDQSRLAPASTQRG